ncbi:MAG: DUF1553 domain-containing protein [Planctomycetes bacterium]|nr:DUF1553 domain-containing protein [Planctomycetota bacterium]
MLNQSFCLSILLVFLSSPMAVLAESPNQIAMNIIIENCLDCHSGNKPKGGLDLSTRENLFKGGDSGPSIETNNSSKGLIQEVLEEGRMPPKKPLDKKHVAYLKNWIKNGAKYPTPKIDIFSNTTSKRAGKDWWSLLPIKKTPIPYPVDNNLGLQPLDYFIFDELKKLDLKPAEPADRRTLIRRVYLDLTGLPPAPEDVTKFLADESYDAFGKIVDKLLSSPGYGEKWARHWLDIVRYGESDGFERNAPRLNSWHYRDWVINALNSDMPYDQFVQMQIAGDAIFPDSTDSILAMGFLVAGIHNTVLGANAEAREIARQDEMEDLVSSIGQTFLGLTINCARCHDHKFDPISQNDYYQMVANLSGVRQGSVPVPNKTIIKEIIKANEQKAALNKSLADIEKVALAKIGTKAGSIIPSPIAQWDFRKDGKDNQGNLTLKLEGNAKLTANGLELDGKNSVARSSTLKTDIKEKTLEAFVILSNLNQKGGGVLTIETKDGNLFDSIVFAEQESARWMAGSNFYQRTQSFKGMPENEAHLKPVHLAITYSQDGKITAYRNGKIYGTAYQSKGVALFPASNSIIAFGMRHEPPSGNHLLAGTILKARVFDKALTANDISNLFEESGIFVSENDLTTNLNQEQLGLRKKIKEEISKLESDLKLLNSKKENATIYSAISAPPLSTKFLNRGQVTEPGNEVFPGNISVPSFPGNPTKILPNASDPERRASLAKWITAPSNPLFARVIVNRIWHYHFGNGIVDTPSDFGFNGSKPTHPELLDHLSQLFIDSGYSLKQLHRSIILSRTYQQASKPSENSLKKDFDNRYLWRWAPRRLDAESIRDSSLKTCGTFNQEMNGPGFSDYKTESNNGTTYYNPIEKLDFNLSRHSIYRFTPRGANQGLLDSFDCPDNSSAAPKRSKTTTPIQALTFWNGPFTQNLSESYPKNHPDFESLSSSNQKINHVFNHLLQRLPSDIEKSKALILVEKHGYTPLIRAILNSNEFLTLE